MNLVYISLISSLLSLIKAQSYELLLDHKNVANGYFSSSLKTTGLENEADPTANTYSIIGNFDASLRSQYQDANGAYGFKLVYRYSDGTIDTLIWTQTSWITDATVTGADLSQIPDQSGKIAERRFVGLALSTSPNTYLDGSPSYAQWYHAVGSNSGWTASDGVTGIPADRGADTAAYAQHLYILNVCGECGDDSVCVSGVCEKNCKILDIDGFLSDCSADFAQHEAEMMQLQSDVITNKNSIGTLETKVTDILTTLGAMNTALDGLSAAQSPGSNFIGGNENYNGIGIDHKSPLISTGSKDLLIVLLLILNMASLCIVASFWIRSSRKGHSKYDKVQGYETEESIQLKH